jgi:DNA primase
MSDFARVKEALNLRNVIPQLTGLALDQKSGHLAECPLCSHKDCFSIPKGGKYDGTWKCHSCGKGGDVFSFFEAFEGLDKKGSLERGAKLAGITLEEKQQKKKPLEVGEQIRIEAAEYYHGHLLENGGKEYFLDRRGHLTETLTAEKVGWSDGHLLDHLRGKGFSDQDILATGLAKEKEIEGARRVLDYFPKGMAIFPHWNRKKVLHFTMKDPRQIPTEEKLKFQLKNEHRDKRWTFYGQEVLEQYEEVILVEGEHDRLQVLNTGVRWVMAMIGQISDEQIKDLASKCKTKHLYLWTDNDHGGRGYIRKICTTLQQVNVRVVVYGKPGDDPDSYLKGFEGDRKREVRRLQMEALDYISWEIQQAMLLPTLEDKRRHLEEPGVFDKLPDQLAGKGYTNIFRIIGRQELIHQDEYKQKLERLGFSLAAIEQALDFSQDLYKQITEYQAVVGNPKDADPIVLAEIIYKFFAHHGRFYFDRENTVYLIYQNRTYEVSKNTAFNALMLKMTRMIVSQAPGAQVWDALVHTAYLNGRRIDMSRWIYTDTDKDCIFYNLNSPSNVILKLCRERIEEVQNGMNDDHVLLASSSKIMPFNFLPDTEIQEGMQLLKELVFDNLAVKREQRFLILCWLISGFCPEMAPYQFIMKFEGYASSGKSTAAKLITALLYKTEDLSDSSAAAAFSSAAKNPLVVIDNLENKDLNRGLQKFLLLAATRGQKEKRKGGTDTDTVDESPRALICVTAIEPFTLSELISRTFVLPFDRRVHGSDNFHESEVLEQLKKKRDRMLSALLRFMQMEVLPNLEQRREFITILNKTFKGHAKDRTNAYLALLMLILEKLLKYIPYFEGDTAALLNGIENGDKDIYTAWIEEQNASSKETEIGSNNILHFLDGIIKEHLQHFKGKTITLSLEPGIEGMVTVLEHPDYGLRIIKHEPEEFTDHNEKYHKTVFEFVATSAEIVDAFDRYAKLTGKRNTYDSASIFTARLRNDLSLLKKSGWELESKEGVEPYYRVVRGKRFLKFKHTLIR